MSKVTARTNIANYYFGTKLLDSYSSAAFAYSFRKLRNAYAGSAVRIRRSSDNAEQNVGFDAIGNFDTGAATTFIGGGSGFIVTWFDQSLNGLDVTQATAGNQPAYLATATNSKPGVDFDGLSDQLLRSSVTMANYITTNGNIIVACHYEDLVQINAFFDWNGDASTTNRLIGAWLRNVGNQMLFDLGSDSAGRLVNVLTFADNTDHIVEFWRNASDLQNITADGGPNINATKTDDITSAAGNWSIGASSNGTSNWFEGAISEVIGWGPYVGDANRAAIYTDVSTYW